jgi:hypothetical protein
MKTKTCKAEGCNEKFPLTRKNRLFCEPKCAKRTFRKRYGKSKKVSRQITCKQCGVTRASYYKDMCGACKRQKERVGSCGLCESVYVKMPAQDIRHCPSCDREKLLGEGWVPVLMLHANSEKERRVWKRLPWWAPRPSVLPLIVTANDKQWSHI